MSENCFAKIISFDDNNNKNNQNQSTKSIDRRKQEISLFVFETSGFFNLKKEILKWSLTIAMIYCIYVNVCI